MFSIFLFVASTLRSARLRPGAVPEVCSRRTRDDSFMGRVQAPSLNCSPLTKSSSCVSAILRGRLKPFSQAVCPPSMFTPQPSEIELYT